MMHKYGRLQFESETAAWVRVGAMLVSTEERLGRLDIVCQAPAW